MPPASVFYRREPSKTLGNDIHRALILWDDAPCAVTETVTIRKCGYPRTGIRLAGVKYPMRASESVVRR